MKKLVLNFAILAYGLLGVSAFSQTENEAMALGLPGDNLNLYAVLDAFQNSPTLEEFERTLNSRESNINNLDLNNDNAIDYIEVVSNKEGNSFNIVLGVAINNYEYQDVAVIEGHKNYSGKVIVQIIGDEVLYGKDYILEPSFSETQNPGYVGNQNSVASQTNVYYVNQWPIVNYVFSSGFSIYASPWHWGFYPNYWNPWQPVYYHVYWGYNSRYYQNNYYRRSSYIRYPLSHSYYVKRRQISPIVNQHKIEGRYNGVYDGRTYSKPVTPISRSVSPTNQRGVVPSSNQQSTRRGAPSTTRSSSKTVVPTTRRSNTNTTRSTTTPQSTKQVAPSTTRSSSKTEVPATRQSTTNTTRSTTTPQSTKQVAPSTTRSSSKTEAPTTRRSTTNTTRSTTTPQNTKK